MIAMATWRAIPKLLIADEPTTALDVTIQAQILELLIRSATQTTGMALVLITHDMGVVAETAERVSRAICRPPSRSATPRVHYSLFRAPHHPYTAAHALGALPDRSRGAGRLPSIPSRAWCRGRATGPRGCQFNAALRPSPTIKCRTVPPPLSAGDALGARALPLRPCSTLHSRRQKGLRA